MPTSKDIVIEFYTALIRRDFDTIRRLARPDYIQHNPNFEDGLDGLIETLRGFTPVTKLAEGEMMAFERVIAEGDWVMTLRRMPAAAASKDIPGAIGSNVDIFRIQDGLIAEHWDYQEQFPRGSNPPRNSNGPF